jgi:hypothetical protein
MVLAFDALVRQPTVDDVPQTDARIVVTPDGRAALFALPNGQPALIAAMTEATWGVTGDGVVVVSNGASTWRGKRDTRCGSCGGRDRLRMADYEPLLPHVEEHPEGWVDQGTLADTPQ